MIPVLFNILFFLIPLIFFKNTSELFEFNKIVTLYILTAMISATWTINSIRARKIIFSRTILDWPLIIYLVIYLASTFTSIDVRTSIFGYYSRFNGGLLSQICYAVLYWAFVSNLNKKQSLNTIYYLMASTAVASVMAALEHFGIFATCGIMNLGWNESCWVQDVKTRVFSTLGQPNWLAALLVALIPLTWKKSYWHYLPSILFFVTLLFTKSRSGLLAFGIEVFIYLVFIFWYSKHRYLKIIGLVLTSVVLFFSINPSKVYNQLPTTSGPALETGGTESGTIRKFVWLGAYDVFKHYSILGSGPETFAYSFPMYKPVLHNLTSEWDFIYNKAHNEFLNYLANTGLLGFITYLLLISCSVIIMLKSRTYDILAGYIAILVTNFFGFSVVPVSLLFFLFPAFAITRNLPDHSLEKYQKLVSSQKMIIAFVLILTTVLLYMVINYWRADVYYNKARLTKNLDAINKALTLSPNEPLYISQLALFNFDLATSDRAVVLSPYNQNIRKILVSNLVKSANDNPDNLLFAEKVLLDGISVSPNDPKLHYQLGILQLELNKNNEAVLNLQKSVELKENYKEGRFALGATYKALNEDTKAKEQFEYIINYIDSNDDLTKKYLNELNQPQ